MGRGGLYTGDICTFGAIMKIIEVGATPPFSQSVLCRKIHDLISQWVLVFVTLLVHRRGGTGGTYVFFGTAGISMGNVRTIYHIILPIWTIWDLGAMIFLYPQGQKRTESFRMNQKCVRDPDPGSRSCLFMFKGTAFRATTVWTWRIWETEPL